MAAKSEQGSTPNNQTSPASGRAPRATPLRNELESISKLVDELETATSTLPYVNESGESECPFSENLYAKKEELEEQVSGKENLLAGYLMELDAEKLRCQKELDKIQEDYRKLNLQQTSDHYAEAILAQQEKCRSIEDDREAVSIVLVTLKAVLKMAKERKFPGRKPQTHFPIPVGASGTLPPPPQSPGPQSPAGRLGDEVGGLISLGPLGQTQEKI